ncbi:MAG: hypothetical protein EBR42_03730 [Betaproteobacteria bacterium]|nr:hypothetical protein [Betaproteobacteria bacterium]
MTGCASQPKPAEPVEQTKQPDPAMEKVVQDLNAILSEQSAKIKTVEALGESIKEQTDRLTAVEVKPPMDRRSQEKQDEAARELEIQKAVQATVSKVPSWFLSTEPNPDHIFANATEASNDLQMSIDMAMLSGKRQLTQTLGEVISTRMTDFAAQSSSNDEGSVKKEVERVTKAVIADIQLGGYHRDKIEIVPAGKNFRTYVRLSYSTADMKRIMAKELQKTEVFNTKVRRTKAFEELEKEIELAKEFKAKNKAKADAE